MCHNGYTFDKLLLRVVFIDLSFSIKLSLDEIDLN